MATKIVTILPPAIEQVLQGLTGELRAMGVSHIGHGIIVEGQMPTAFFSSAEWAARYDEEDLISRDPVRACALTTNYHLIPWEAILMNKEQRMVLNERKRIFEAKSGLLISIKTPAFHETLAMGCDSTQFSMMDLFNKRHQTMLHYLLQLRKAHLAYYSANKPCVDAKEWVRPLE